MFDNHLKRWGLEPDGNPIITPGSRLLPVRQGQTPAMLKIALGDEEKIGASLMVWWNGNGAARVLEHADDALLLERAQGEKCLRAMTLDGKDDEACRIICGAVAQLHEHQVTDFVLPMLVPLDIWFSELHRAATRNGGLLAFCAEAARELLASQRDMVVLHGDIHHRNILDFDNRGWLAIDPKGLIGERTFDYANLFCNPNFVVASDSKRFIRRLDIVVDVAGLDRKRMLQWILAYAGLSAAWFMEDGGSPETPMAIAQLAAAELALI